MYSIFHKCVQLPELLLQEWKRGTLINAKFLYRGGFFYEGKMGPGYFFQWGDSFTGKSLIGPVFVRGRIPILQHRLVMISVIQFCKSYTSSPLIIVMKRGLIKFFFFGFLGFFLGGGGGGVPPEQ